MNGNLQVNFLSGYDPQTGLLPEWFTAADGFSGGFSNISWTGLGEGKGVTLDSSTGRLGIVSIPEPSSLILLFPAMGLLVVRRRR